MFKLGVSCLSSNLGVITALLRQEVRSLTNQSSKEKWDLLSAVCLERRPIITQPKNEIETKYQALLDQIDLEHSMLCDFEIRGMIEKKKGTLKKNDDTRGVIAGQTTDEFEAVSKEEYKQFVFAPRVTEADEKGIKTTLERKLDKNLVLLVEHKLGNSCFWIPPQGIRKDGETMRQAAERVLQDVCGKDLDVQFYGNAPIGFYKYMYPKDVQKNGTCGAKIFYFLAKYKKGSISNGVQYQWLDREELQDTLPKSLYKSVSQFLIPE